LLEQAIDRALHTERAAIDDVGVDHGRTDIGVTEQLLNSANVVTRLEQVGCERMPERVAARRLSDSRAPNSAMHRSLQCRLVHVVTSPFTCNRVAVGARGRKHPLPSPVAWGVRVFGTQRMRKLYIPRPAREVRRMLR